MYIGVLRLRSQSSMFQWEYLTKTVLNTHSRLWGVRKLTVSRDVA